MPRFRLRSLLLMVALAAAALGAGALAARRAECLSRAEYHRAEEARWRDQADLEERSEATPAFPHYVGRAEEMVGHHRRLRAKYERAAGRPWLAVGPDPPEPPGLDALLDRFDPPE